MVNERIREQQGFITHHQIPEKYGRNKQTSWVNWIIESPTPIVYITWIDYVKITLSAAFTTPSGMQEEKGTLRWP